MVDETVHHVTVRLARGYEFVAEFNDLPGAPPMLFDEPEPLGGNRAPSAAAVLAAAVGNCLAASVTYCLRRAHVDVQEMTAQVKARVARNDKGRYRVHGIDVELTPMLGDGSPASIDRCAALFEDFCVVTASVKQGIPVRVALKRPLAVSAGNA
jgi:uncharacterized OsmC-like protein